MDGVSGRTSPPVTKNVTPGDKSVEEAAVAASDMPSSVPTTQGVVTSEQVSPEAEVRGAAAAPAVAVIVDDASSDGEIPQATRRSASSSYRRVLSSESEGEASEGEVSGPGEDLSRLGSDVCCAFCLQIQ